MKKKYVKKGKEKDNWKKKFLKKETKRNQERCEKNKVDENRNQWTNDEEDKEINFKQTCHENFIYRTFH